ncbi:YxeA family protein [Lactococcus petauri]|uniref:YxeA family protein n=1 Tax=Lactococcus petauri TaxID=1940789 RepID=UPI0025514E1C|nr:YxeA family protein [Lactococcus petauri]
MIKVEKTIKYTYLVQGYDEKGNNQTLKFSTIYKIKPYTYLEVFYNKEKGSIDWIGRDRSEIPKNALEYLQ